MSFLFHFVIITVWDFALHLKWMFYLFVYFLVYHFLI